jgi:hypothetical protein
MRLIGFSLSRSHFTIQFAESNQDKPGVILDYGAPVIAQPLRFELRWRLDRRAVQT